jgi:hypothetical protein
MMMTQNRHAKLWLAGDVRNWDLVVPDRRVEGRLGGRVVTRDAHRFPELGRRYHEETTGTRDAKFAGYLDLRAKREGWRVRDKHAAAQVFAGLLKARIFDEVLLGLRQPSGAEIVDKAREAAKRMLLLLNNGRF